MREQKKIVSVSVILLVVLSIGVLAGVTVSNLSKKPEKAASESKSNRFSFNRYISDRLLRNLDLSDDQVIAIKAEQESMNKELGTLREQFIPAMNEVIEETATRIEDHLSDKQKATLAKNREEVKKRMNRGSKSRSSEWKKKSHQWSKTTNWDDLLKQFDTNGDGGLEPSEIAYAKSKATPEKEPTSNDHDADSNCQKDESSCQ